MQIIEAVGESWGNTVDLIQRLLEAVVLGIVQGVTEFLPISSTAHLVVFKTLLGWNTFDKAYVDAIQFGSVIAVIGYFWSDIRQIVTGGWAAAQSRSWEREEWKLLVGIAAGTLPVLGLGLLVKKFLPEDALESLTLIAIASIIMALLLGLAEKVGSRKRKFDSLQVKDGILVGLGQMLAIFPGVSRSGSTLTAALFLGLERQTAARFSFLLGIPALTLITLYQSLKAFKSIDSALVLLVGIISTLIFSYLSIAFLLRFLQRNTNWVFVWYRLAFGTALLVAIAGGVLK
jgi:undecaprenyl-diphosphatase